MLAELTCLLCQRFSMVNQAERFWTELRNWRRKPGEELQQLYNKVCHLMSLAYPRPSSDLSHLIRFDAFLEMLNDASLHVCILDKILATMKEVLRITLNLKALDKSKDVETRVKEDWIKRAEQTKRASTPR